MSAKRINDLRKKLVADNLDGMIVTHLDYIRYLTGFTGSAGLLIIGSKRTDFLTDFRYSEQAKKQVKGARVFIVKRDPLEELKEFPQFQEKNMRLGFDGDHLTMTQWRRLEHVWPDVLLVRAEKALFDLGWVKDKQELVDIKAAVDISDTAFEHILPLIAPGVRENEVAAELEYQMTMLGSEKPAFETIAASGPRSAMPHGVASLRKMKKGDFLTLDFGATVNGYVSDMTRTVVIGKATPRQKKIYALVLRAQKAGIRRVKAGVSGKVIDQTARRIIEKAGFGKNFGHGLGHGIGYFVHIGPRLSPLSTDTLQVNNVVTVEPGIYITGWGGVRIEDDVVVTRNGAKVLNKAPKNLLEL